MTHVALAETFDSHEHGVLVAIHEDLEDLKTVGDAVDYVVARLAQAS